MAKATWRVDGSVAEAGRISAGKAAMPAIFRALRRVIRGCNDVLRIGSPLVRDLWCIVEQFPCQRCRLPGHFERLGFDELKSIVNLAQPYAPERRIAPKA